MKFDGYGSASSEGEVRGMHTAINLLLIGRRDID